MKTEQKAVLNKRVISSVRASMNFEGLKPSSYAQRVGKDYLEGKLSSKDAFAKIKAKHADKFGK